MSKNRELVKSINYHFEQKNDEIILHTKIKLYDGKVINGICELRTGAYINLDRLYVDLSDSKILYNCGIGSWMMYIALNYYIENFNYKGMVLVNSVLKSIRYYEKLGFQLNGDADEHSFNNVMTVRTDDLMSNLDKIIESRRPQMHITQQVEPEEPVLFTLDEEINRCRSFTTKKECELNNCNFNSACVPSYSSVVKFGKKI